MKITERRIGFIIRSIKKGIPPALVADDFGRSRERIRQIFEKEVGQNPKEYIKEQDFYIGYLQKPLYLPERFCNRCAKKFVPHKDGAGFHFCSPFCRDKMYERELNPLYIRRCYICHSQFMPWRASRTSYSSVKVRRGNSLRYFCRMSCFTKYLGYKRIIHLMQKTDKKHALKS